MASQNGSPALVSKIAVAVRSHGQEGGVPDGDLAGEADQDVEPDGADDRDPDAVQDVEPVRPRDERHEGGAPRATTSATMGRRVSKMRSSDA